MGIHRGKLCERVTSPTRKLVRAGFVCVVAAVLSSGCYVSRTLVIEPRRALIVETDSSAVDAARLYLKNGTQQPVTDCIAIGSDLQCFEGSSSKFPSRIALYYIDSIECANRHNSQIWAPKTSQLQTVFASGHAYWSVQALRMRQDSLTFYFSADSQPDPDVASLMQATLAVQEIDSALVTVERFDSGKTMSVIISSLIGGALFVYGLIYWPPPPPARMIFRRSQGKENLKNPLHLSCYSSNL